MRLEQFAQIVGNDELAQKWYQPMVDAMAEFQINTARRKAAFLGQIMHESAKLTQLSENLNYSSQGLANTWPGRYAVDPKAAKKVPNALALKLHRRPELIANHTYANRMGNGGPETGDGWNHRGMGPKQITGKDNQRACGKALGVDLLSDPSRLMQPEAGSRSAAWFFASNGLNELADQWKLQAISGVINVGNKSASAAQILGLPQRMALSDKCLTILGATA